MNAKPRLPAPSSRGFTLIELMITVAIIAILAAIAIPAYTAYVTRSKLPEAFSGLSGMSLAMQQYDQDNRSFGTVGQSCPNTVALPTSQDFDFACAATCVVGTCAGNVANGFTITATGKATSPTLVGLSYSIDQDGKKMTLSVPASGWTVNANVGAGSTCWVRDQSGDC